MGNLKRVVVTGMGAITPLGENTTELWSNLKNGNIGIDFITRFDTANYKAKVAGEIKNFEPEKHIQKKETKRMDLYCQYAMYAAGEAVINSGLSEELLKNNARAGVVVGTGIGGIGTIEEQVAKLNEKGPDRVSPLFIPTAIVNIGAGNIAIRYGMTGFCTAPVTACATGTNAVGDAFRAIKHGYADIILAGGSEAPITKASIAGFTSLTALSESHDPKRASIPFDKDRNGFVMGEGAGILVLEELKHALNRGATIYAEIVGYGSNCDAYHMTAPNPDGAGAAAAMELAISEAGIDKTQISYINAHGTSTPHNDPAETKAIKAVFGEYAYKIPVSSTKSMTGHLMGATGAVEAIACVMAAKENFIPPTMGLETPDELCDLNYVPKKGIEHTVNYALSNSFGFGGHNAVLCFKKWEA